MVRTVTNTLDSTVIGVDVEGVGQPCLLVHGTTADKSRWRELIERHPGRYMFVTYDRRGRGDSGDHQDYALEKEIIDLEAILADINEPVMLLGHSSGAIISLEACCRNPDKVQKLILYEPPIPTGSPLYDSDVLDELQREIEKGHNSRALKMFFSRVLKMPDHEIDNLMNTPVWDVRVKQAHTIPREIIASEHYQFERDKFFRLHVPTLLLKGGDSPEKFTMPIDLLGEVLPNSKIVSMPGQQHVAMNTNPELFEDIVFRFFSDT
jgi:pimeloyl-ACP methyl ester carboxylesterase